MSVPGRLGRAAVAGVLVIGGWTYSSALSAQQSASAAELLQAGDVLMAGSQYGDATRAYRHARETDDPSIRVRAGAGVVRSLLRLGMFKDGAREGADVAARDPQNATAISIHADSLWAFGLF